MYYVIYCVKTGFVGTTHYADLVSASRAALNMMHLTEKDWDVKKIMVRAH